MKEALLLSLVLVAGSALLTNAQSNVLSLDQAGESKEASTPSIESPLAKSLDLEPELSPKAPDVSFAIKRAKLESWKPTFSMIPPTKTAEQKDPREKIPPLAPAAQAPDATFQWSAAIKQSMVFLAVQHGYAFSQPKTRESIKGPFFRDYWRSLKALNGWGDGGKFFTNYIAHPMQGSFLGFIQVQNDPKGKSLEFSKSPAYIKSRLKALAWSAAWSTQFEIGPASQASIGNVGIYGKQTYVDLIITPTVGIALLVAEDALDKYLLRKIERMYPNRYLKFFIRMIFNPTRTMANLVRLETPWHRDKGLR